MKFYEYCEPAISTAIYKNRGNNRIYPFFGLFGEIGELSEKFKKSLRDDDGIISEERKSLIVGEIGDILWYMSAICFECKIDPKHVQESSKSELATEYNYEYFLETIVTLSSLAEIIYNYAIEYDFPNEVIIPNISKMLGELSLLCKTLSISLSDAMQNNVDKLLSRKIRGVLKGDGDNR